MRTSKLLCSIGAGLSLCALAPAALAETKIYTFDDMTWVPDQAPFTFNTQRYWEWQGADRWGTVWERPWGFSTTYPSANEYGHFHIDFKRTVECAAETGMGRFVSGRCVAWPTDTLRGPFLMHTPEHQLHFQVVRQNGTLVPFDLLNLDLYDAAGNFINVYIRSASGAWYWWRELEGYGDERTPVRWHFGAAPTQVVTVVWKRSPGTTFAPASVGRISVET